MINKYILYVLDARDLIVNRVVDLTLTEFVIANECDPSFKDIVRERYIAVFAVIYLQYHPACRVSTELYMYSQSSGIIAV